MDKKKKSKGPKKDKNPVKLTKAKIKALELISKYPDKPKLEIGRELVRLGLIVKADNIYQMTRADRDGGYMAQEISIIREKNAETLSKRIVPKALSLHEKALNRKLSKEDRKDPVKVTKHEANQFKYIKLAEDKEFGTDETKRPFRPITVNIEHLQAIMAQSFNVKPGNPQQDAIDIKEDDIAEQD